MSPHHSAVSLEELLDAVREYAFSRGYVATSLRIKLASGEVISHPVPPNGRPHPPPDGRQAEPAADLDDDDPPDDFTPVLNDFQERILQVLDGKALKVEALARRLDLTQTSRFYKPGGLKELKERNLVRHHNQLGYYRPDRPPPQLAKNPAAE